VSPLLGYVTAVAAIALVVALKLVIPRMGTDAPFLLMLIPTMLAAWRGGMGPGLAAAVLGIVAVNFFFLAPTFDVRVGPEAILHSCVFCATNVIAAVLTASLQTARRTATAAQRSAETEARRIEGLYRLGLALAGARRVEDVAEVLLHETVIALRGTLVAVYVVSEEDQTLRLVTYLGSDAGFLPLAELDVYNRIPLTAEAPGPLTVRSRALVVLESEQELRARFPAHAAAAQGRRLPPAAICAPMIVHDRVIGVLGVLFSEPRSIGSGERSWAQAVAQACGMAVQRVRLHEQEHRARVEAEDAVRIKDEFLFVVSTELRAPLTTIVGWAHLLRKSRHAERARYEHGLEVIERSAQAEARLVDDILDLARITARKLTFDLRSTDLARVVRAGVEELKVEAAAKGVELAMRSRVGAVVMGDERRLRQVVDKVVTNAVRFTPPGGRVTVDMERRRQRVGLVVRDDGRGIDPGELSHILEPLRTDGDAQLRSERGLGLGLPIANFIVQEHKGTFRVESDGVGLGTKVTIELPIAEPVAGMLSISAERETRGPLLSGRRILVVDDDTDAREALTELLSAEGAQVHSAHSTDALLEVRDFAPHVIVTNTDAERGREVIRSVRALPAPLSSTPALALVTRMEQDDGAAAQSAGYQRRMAKPPEPKALTDAIQQLVQDGR
jgi:K+-sensing histidine kinase KdpD